MNTPEPRTDVPCSVNYPLFEHMSREHGLTLTESEMAEIVAITSAAMTARAEAAESLAITLRDAAKRANGYAHFVSFHDLVPTEAARIKAEATAKDVDAIIALTPASMVSKLAELEKELNSYEGFKVCFPYRSIGNDRPALFKNGGYYYTASAEQVEQAEIKVAEQDTELARLREHSDPVNWEKLRQRAAEAEPLRARVAELEKTLDTVLHGNEEGGLRYWIGKHDDLLVERVKQDAELARLRGDLRTAVHNHETVLARCNRFIEQDDALRARVTEMETALRNADNVRALYEDAEQRAERLADALRGLVTCVDENRDPLEGTSPLITPSSPLGIARAALADQPAQAERMISLHDHTAPLPSALAPSTQPPRDWRGWSGGGVRVLGYAGASHFFDPARRCHLWLVALATGETALRSSRFLETLATA